jgi:hypothetical protein
LIVVSDTTPLNYLVLIGAADVLPQLFDEVFTAQAVVRELSDSRTPQAVRQWIQKPPQWLRIQSPAARLPSTARLDPGQEKPIPSRLPKRSTHLPYCWTNNEGDVWRGRKGWLLFARWRCSSWRRSDASLNSARCWID